MAKLRSAALISAIFAIGSPACGADATQTEADRLKHVFERYIGAPAAGKPGFVSVTADGSAYKVRFDLQHALDLIPAAAATIEASPYVVSLEPKDDGTWKVSMSDNRKMDFAIADQSGSYVYEGYTFDGIFDPALAFFRSSNTKLAKFTGTISAPNLKVDIEGREANGTLSASAGANQTADGSISVSLGSFSETVQTKTPNGGHVPPDAGPVELKIGGGTTGYSFTGVRTQSILDLWAFAIAHQTRDQLVTAAPELKSAVFAALPFVDSLKMTGAFDQFSVQTAYGRGVIGKMAVDVGLSTASPSNTFGEHFKLSDLEVDTVFMPDWARPLVPTSLEFGFDLKDFDFNNGMKTTIEGYDFAHPDPQYFVVNKQKLQEAWLPKGQMVVTIPPSSILAPTYALNWQGDVAISDGHAKAHAEIRMTGFDAVLKAVLQAKQPQVAQAAIGFYAAQALAKKDPDGTLTWVIDSLDGGNFLINGKPVGPQKKQDL